ncbi:MAG: hypothetical protein SF029_25490 [bacterium]|nr:hypothetical protein [bacterium]
MSEDQSFRANMMEGMSRFQGIRARAFWQDIIDHLRGKPAELLSFEDIRQRLRLREESYRGLQDVPLDRIVGSVGRYRDFTRNFLPKSGKMQERWSRVYAQANSMTGLPPIELYKVDDVYFVRDGNHRVSVARTLGSKTIQAHVTELPTTIDLEPGMTDKELDDAAAYAAFLEESGLSHTRPHHQPLMLSERSRYTDLMGHIYLHKYILEKDHGRELSLTEAATDWYDNVYRPALTLFRKYNMAEVLDARTEADLYLWVVEHLREVREEFGEEAPARKISDALVDFLNDRKLPVPDDLLEEKDRSLILTRTQVLKAVAAKAEEEAAKNVDASSNGHVAVPSEAP